MTNENDDWEIEFDRRLEKDHLTIQETNQRADASNLIPVNKPIRILKRPTSQCQLSVKPNSTQSTSQITNSSDSIHSSQTNHNSTKQTIKTYEQREQEYRQARLRIMGEEESSVKDDDLIIADESSKPTFPPPSNAIYFTPNGPLSQQDHHLVYPPMPYPSPSNLWFPCEQQQPYDTQQYSYPPE